MTATTTTQQTERSGRSLTMIERLVDSRTEMLALYTELANQSSLENNPDVPGLLQEFCQSLVDYAANAHFRLYRYFAENNERRQEIYSVAESIYPRILEITNIVLDFNEKYDCEEHCDTLSSLKSDLSELGEHLADRIELEDQLINAFSHSRRATSR